MISRMFYILIRFVYIAIDIFCLLLSIFLACWLRQTTFPMSLHELFFNTANPFHLVFVTWFVTVLFFNAVHRLYETRREVVESHEITQVLRSVLFASITTVMFVYGSKVEGFPRSVFLLTAGITTVMFCVWRLLKRVFVNFLAAQGYNNFNVLIVGAGRVGLTLAEEIRRNPGFGLKIVGFLDDRKTSADLKGHYEVLGTLAHLKEVARRRFITKVFITIHPAGNVFQQMLEAAKDLKLAVRVVPQAFDQATGEIFKYNIGFIPVLEYSALGHARMMIGKRLFDFVLAASLLILLSLFFLVIMVLIRFDSPGPVFYFSRRYGRNGREFRMWKFRSMVVDADRRLKELQQRNEVDGPIFKIRQDPRVTRLGRFLRKYSLDEIPQLVNVLTGEMSLVGPRPLPTHQVDVNDPRQLRRLEVRPGITGLWQVRGRSDLTFNQLVGWDTWYINNWSFSLDISILMRTPAAVLAGRGAY